MDKGGDMEILKQQYKKLADSEIIIYDQDALKRVDISDVQNITSNEIKAIYSSYRRYGFALFRFLKDEFSKENIEYFVKRLGLHTLYIPKHFDDLDEKTMFSKGMNYISNSIGYNEKTNEAFYGNGSLNLHVDATGAPIGIVKSSLLFCVTPAAYGGESTIFNSCEAFKHLFKEDPALAFALTNEKALKRIKNFDYADRVYNVGPAFSLIGGEIVTRYSDDYTCCWQDSFKEVECLEEAYNRMAQLSQDDKYYTEFKLLQGEGLIMANDKVSHGRKAFVDSVSSKRKMIRVLYYERISSC